jgi:hypothetical protein
MMLRMDRRSLRHGAQSQSLLYSLASKGGELYVVMSRIYILMRWTQRSLKC